MGVPLIRLAAALDLNYQAVRRNPSARELQTSLQLLSVTRVAELCREFFPRSKEAKVWLNTPHPDLGGKSALGTILAKNSLAVLILLENAAAGVPV